MIREYLKALKNLLLNWRSRRVTPDQKLRMKLSAIALLDSAADIAASKRRQKFKSSTGTEWTIEEILRREG